MSWWIYILVMLCVLLVIRWVMVTRNLQRQQPSIAAMSSVFPDMMKMKERLDLIEAHPNLDGKERTDGIQTLEAVKYSLITILRNDVDDIGMAYVRSWLELNDLALEYYERAPYNLNLEGDRVLYSRLLQRRVEFDKQALRFVTANQPRSFLMMLLVGVPRIRPVK